MRRLKMKLVLNSNYEEARNLGKVFVGAEVELKGLFGQDGNIAVLDGITRSPMFICDHPTLSHLYYDEITIDLSKSTPCIYQAMKYGLKVEVEWDYKHKPNSLFDFSEYGAQSQMLRLYGCYEIKSIKLLNLDQMEGIEVVG